MTFCLPDHHVGQLNQGPEEDREGHRWWRLIGGLTGRQFIKGWVSESSLEFKAEGTLTFKGVQVGDRVGDFTVEYFRAAVHEFSEMPVSGFQPQEQPEFDYEVAFSGETVLDGTYGVQGVTEQDDTVLGFVPSTESSRKLPRWDAELQGWEGPGTCGVTSDNTPVPCLTMPAGPREQLLCLGNDVGDPRVRQLLLPLRSEPPAGTFSRRATIVIGRYTVKRWPSSMLKNPRYTGVFYGPPCSATAYLVDVVHKE